MTERLVPPFVRNLDFDSVVVLSSVDTLQITVSLIHHDRLVSWTVRPYGSSLKLLRRLLPTFGVSVRHRGRKPVSRTGSQSDRETKEGEPYRRTEDQLEWSKCLGRTKYPLLCGRVSWIPRIRTKSFHDPSNGLPGRTDWEWSHLYFAPFGLECRSVGVPVSVWSRHRCSTGPVVR